MGVSTRRTGWDFRCSAIRRQFGALVEPSPKPVGGRHDKPRAQPDGWRRYRADERVAKAVVRDYGTPGALSGAGPRMRGTNQMPKGAAIEVYEIGP
jgi:hypothetical protein